MTAAAERARTLGRLDGESFDVLVVGGGATGAAIARDAGLRGLRVALVEAGDFGGETSSRSSKLIHGGLRYLQYGDFALVFEALAERRRLMSTAPHLCRPIEFLFPAYQGLEPELRTLGAGIALYNALALWRPPVGGRRLDAREVFELSPHLRAAGLQGAQLYVDCQTDDARLVLETVLDAVAVGVAVAPRLLVTALRRSRAGRVHGALARDRIGGGEVAIEARVVVNATGPFSDAFDRGRHNLRPTLGVHLVFEAARLPHGGRATVLRSPRDGRLVFLLPAGARTFLGTTDTDWVPVAGTPRAPRPGDAITARAADVDYLLEVGNAAFPPLDLRTEDVISAFAGLRPLVAVPAHTTSSTSREHELLIEPDGLLTIVGGKLTTYRRMAEEVVNVAVDLARDRGYEGPIGPCTTKTRPLPGGRAVDLNLPNLPSLPNSPDLPDWAGAGSGSALPHDVVEHLKLTYGSRWPDVAALAAAPAPPLPAKSVDLAARIQPDLPYCWAEVVHAARHELVMEIEDVLRRRVPLHRDTRDQGLGAAPIVADILAAELGWSAERRAGSLISYQRAVAETRGWHGSM